MQFVEDVLEDIKNQLDNQDIAKLLREAEAMLKEIREKDFRDDENAADYELEKALESEYILWLSLLF